VVDDRRRGRLAAPRSRAARPFATSSSVSSCRVESARSRTRSSAARRLGAITCGTCWSAWNENPGSLERGHGGLHGGNVSAILPAPRKNRNKLIP
jgi:hypothetical protein